MKVKTLMMSLAAMTLLSGQTLAEDNFYEAGRWFVDGSISIHESDQDSPEGHDNKVDIDEWDVEVSYSVIDNLTVGIGHNSAERDISSVGGFHNAKSKEKASGYGIDVKYHFQLGAMPKLRPFVSAMYIDTTNKSSATNTFSGFPGADAMNTSVSSSVDLSGMGYQIGATYTITNNFAIQAKYRWEDLDGSGTDHDGRLFNIGLVIAL
jgi:outer membrane protein W